MLIRGGKILLSLRKNTGYRDGWYSFPAGHIEDNESLRAGTCREINEETGLKLSPSDLILTHVMHRKEDDIRMDFFFTTDKKGLAPKNMEPNKADDIRWFRFVDLPKNTIPYIRAAIDNYQKKIFYSEFGWD